MKITPRATADAPLVRAWLAAEEPATAFFPGDPTAVATYARVADATREEEGRPDREVVATALAGGGADAAGRLGRFVGERGFVVTTGQQPALFGGPLYVLYKALTVIELARRLEDALSVPVLPVFWIGSEDHDWDEARTATLLDSRNTLRTVELPSRTDRMDPLHRIVPGRDMEEALGTFLGHLPESDFSPAWNDLLSEACHARASFAEAFEGILTALLADRGLFTIQSHAPELKQASLPLLLSELDQSAHSGELGREVAARLQAAGYAARVPIPEGATNLFLEGALGRDRLVGDDGGFRLRRSGERLTPAELRSRVEDDPSILSPNVLLRPVVERWFLPTLAYVGGPAELEYLPQSRPLFDLHELEPPALHPRAALTLLEGKVGKVLEKYGLEPDELAVPVEELAARLLREELPGDLRGALGRFRGTLSQLERPLVSEVKAVDPTLEDAARQVRTSTMAKLDELERKVVQALKRENQVALRQLGKAHVHLFPGGTPQERTFGPWYYLFRYGAGFLDQVATAAGQQVLPGRPVGTAGSLTDARAGSRGTGGP